MQPSSFGVSRLGINAAARFIHLGLLMAIGFWFTPYLIAHLGVAAYGLVPLFAQLTEYLRILTLASNAALGRFMMFSLGGQDTAAANRVFNTSLVTTALLILGLGAVGLWLVPRLGNLVTLPVGSEPDARLLMIAALASFLILALAAPFEISAFCANRLDVGAVVQMAAAVMRVAIVVALFQLSEPALWQVGVALVAASLLSLGGAVAVWRRLTPELRVRPGDWDSGTFRRLSSMGAWSAVNHVGTVLLLAIDLLVINHLLGPEAAGLYAACLQWPALIRTFGSTLSPVFAPTVTRLHAVGDDAGTIGFCLRSVRLMGIVVALPVALTAALAEPLLRLWLGAPFAALAPLLVLMTAPLCVNLSFLPLHQVAVATGRVRTPGLVSIGIGAVNLALAIALAGPAGLGLYGVALAGMLTLTAKNLLFTPIYAARVLARPAGTFLMAAAPGVATTAVLAALAFALATGYRVTSWAQLIIVAGVVSLAYPPVAWLAVSVEDRALVRRYAADWRARRLSGAAA